MNDLDTLYFPNKWSKRYPFDEVVPKHIEFATSASERARNSIPSELNIPYGSREKEKFDIFGKDLENDAPIFIFVHGGYWQKDYLRRDTYHFIASNLHKNGIKSIFIGYELCPNVTIQEIIDEISVATKKCIEYATQNKSRGVYLAGYSSGAHLVATLFTNLTKTFSNEDRKMIKAAILIAGIYDLSEIPKTSVNVPLKLDENEALRLSPYKQNIPNCIKTVFYVITAENDSPVFKKQAKEFHEELVSLELQSNFYLINNVDHFDVVELLENENFQVVKLILSIISGD